MGYAGSYVAINNSYNTGAVTGTGNYVGGVVGYADSSTVTNCYNTGNITGSDGRVGGVVGYAISSTVTNCYNTGDIMGDVDTGGVVGCAYYYSTNVYYCYNTGTVSGNKNVGGVVGYAYGDPYSIIITNCYNTGNITGSGNYVGGVVGYAEYTVIITNCYNTGSVTGSYYSVGGIAGYSSYSITNCYNTGDIMGDTYTGGVVGEADDSTITNCYNTGDITGDAYTGGVVGYANSSDITNNYYGGNCTLSYGIARPSSNTGATKDENLIANAKSLSWYQDSSKWSSVWDFENVWQIDSNVNNGYPYLSDLHDDMFPNDIEHYWTDEGNYADSFAGGSGTESDPYKIATPEQLARLAYLINSSSTNSTYKSLYYVQTANLDMSEYWWESIGYSSSYYFSGHYDGGGYTISGLYTENGYSNQGLFGYVRGQSSSNKATIKNVGITDSNIQGNDYVGGVVGYAYYSAITNCYNAGTVAGSDYNIGGVVGGAFSYSTITNCYNAGTVTGSGECVGGVVGKAISRSDVTNCYNTGTVSGDSDVGGVVGSAGSVESTKHSDVTNCYNTGIVKALRSLVGGVVGSTTYSSSVTKCYNTGTVTGGGGDVGGVVGYVDFSSVTKCYNTGNVTGGGDHVGGVVGYTYSSSTTITNCYNTGTVTGGGDYVGGVAGRTRRSDVTKCYNSGSVTGNYYVGGIVGCADYYYTPTVVTNSYNTGSVTGRGSSVGGIVGSDKSSTLNNNYYGGNCTLSYGIGSPSSNTGASKDSNLIANAKSLSWYQDSSKWSSSYPWDFEEVWSLVPSANDGYPILQGFSVNITYNSNFGENEVITEQVPSGQEIVIAGYDLFTRVGYEISHWNTKPDGTGLNFYAGDTYSEGAGLTLYAIWEAGIYSVTLDANGGSGGTSAIYLKYDSGWYSSSSCTSSSKITALPSTPTRTGYEFKGYSTEPDGSGTLAVSTTGAINVSDTFYSTDGTRTWYAVWEARNPAYFDSEGGYWYVENGKLPQSKVSESLKGTLSGQWGSLSDGSVYYMGVEELANSEFTSDGGMQSKVYNGEEYVKFNGEYYLVEPIRWRLVYSSSQQEGYAVENTSVLATMAEIVFLGSYSSAKIGVGAGYSAESVTMLLKNQVSTEYLVNESRDVTIFGTTTPKDTTTVSGSVFVASMEELANFTTSKNNTTGSGVKPGKVSLSDFVKDYLRATGQGNHYFTRDLGDQLNTIRCLNPVGNRSQAKAQQTLGVQFTIKVTEYACKEM